MSRERQSDYQIQCPHCKEFFAWYHKCLNNKGKHAKRGEGKDRMKIICWFDEDEEEKKNKELWG